MGQWIGRNADNDIGKSAKIAFLSHGNQAIQPGNYIHGIVDNGSGAGYQRPIKIHGIYRAPLNLHVTPTLAIALEWAAVREGGAEWRSGPALNALIRELVATNVISLMASTYSDHVLPYFTPAFNRHNVELASATLGRIYGANINSNSVFWAPERVLDGDVFGKITNMGFRYTLVDQNTHVFNWFGRTVALGDDGYRINRINGVNCFVINNAADGYRFANHDGGLAMPMRELFSRRARSGRQDQVSTIFCMWEEFNTSSQADAYDLNLRWLANRPWMQLVSLEQIASGSVALPWGQSWEPIDRGNTAGSKQSHDWINHANNENYDNWYLGSWRHEGLLNKRFQIRPGTTNATAYGMLYQGGLASNAWAAASGIVHADVRRLAAEVLHASVFETAFHNESNHDLTRWSFGGYINPGSDYQTLVDFAKVAQNQTRNAAIYAWVDTWAAGATGMATTATASLDVDMDGEAEYVLYNRHVAALFERSGGRMVAAWRRTADGRIRQMIGNLASYAGKETEEEGAWSVNRSEGVYASLETYRNSALKDWWAGTTDYVNALYTATTNGTTNGWRLTSGDGKIAKTVTLAPTATAFSVQYAVDPTLNGGTIYVRHGLSPDLSELLVRGQQGMEEAFSATGGVVKLTSDGTVAGVALAIQQGAVNATATDTDGEAFDSVAMRNLAQTRTVEMVGTNALAFEMAFFVEDSENEPPTIAFEPAGPTTNAVGTTNAFVVTAVDPEGSPVALAAMGLPTGATFNPATGAFSWPIAGMGIAGTTNVIGFTASDGIDVATNRMTVVVPYDANGNDMPDDWELHYFGGFGQGKDGDYDGDGFSNYAEWVASTDPSVPGDYIGWEMQYEAPGGGLTLVFRAKPGGIYHFEGKDRSMDDETSDWFPLGTLTNGSGDTAEWTDANYPTNAARYYRIKIPRHQP